MKRMLKALTVVFLAISLYGLVFLIVRYLKDKTGFSIGAVIETVAFIGLVWVLITQTKSVWRGKDIISTKIESRNARVTTWTILGILALLGLILLAYIPQVYGQYTDETNGSTAPISWTEDYLQSIKKDCMDATYEQTPDADPNYVDIGCQCVVDKYQGAFVSPRDLEVNLTSTINDKIYADCSG